MSDVLRVTALSFVTGYNTLIDTKIGIIQTVPTNVYKQMIKIGQ